MVIEALLHGFHDDKGIVKNSNEYRYLEITITSYGRDE